MKILVLGATGHLGGSTAVALRRSGHEVVACGRRTSDNGFFETQGCRYIGGVVLEDDQSFSKLPQDIDAVVHLAGAMPAHASTNPIPYVHSIVVGMINLCEWMRKGLCRRIVFNTTPSDVSAYFDCPVPVDDDVPRSFPKDGGDHAVYAICKNTAVDILTHYQIAYGFLPCVFRHLTVYGWHPNAFYYLNGEKRVLPYRQIMRRCLAGESVEVWGDPTRLKELLYIDDFTEAVERAVLSQATGIFNLPGFKPYTLEEQIQGFVDVFSPADHPVTKVMCPEKPSTPQNLLAGDKVFRELGWKARCTWNEACRRMRQDMVKNPFEQLWGPVDPNDRVRN